MRSAPPVARVLLGLAILSASPQALVLGARDPAPVPAETPPPTSSAGAAGAGPIAGGACEGQTHVSYVTSRTIYIDAGSDDGLRVGDSVEVVREGALAATLRVTYVSPRRSTCERVGEGAELVVGDVVRFTTTAVFPNPTLPQPGGSTTAPVPAAAVPAPPQPAGSTTALSRDTFRSLRDFGLRGRIGVRYQYVHARSGNDASYRQPGVDVRVDGRALGGAPVDLDVDVRSYQTYRTMPDGTSNTESANRVYRAAIAWRPGGGRLRLAAGRQFAPSLAVLSLFDGVLGGYTGTNWEAGLLSGSQPDPPSYGYSRNIVEHGAWFGFRSAVGSPNRWGVTTGLIGSYDHGEINREFVYLQGRFDNRRFSAFASEEVDINRGWKKEVEKSSFSSTSTFASLRLRLGEHVVVRGGYDDRRSVRLLRDRVTPETEFDDAYRQGGWAGADLDFLSRFRIGLDARTRSGGDAGSADSYTLTLGARNLGPVRLDARTRSTRYTSDQVEGWLHSLTAGVPLGQVSNIALTGGVRNETSRVFTQPDEKLNWYGLDFDLSLGRHWFVLLSVERSQGDEEKNDQAYAAASFRF